MGYLSLYYDVILLIVVVTFFVDAHLSYLGGNSWIELLSFILNFKVMHLVSQKKQYTYMHATTNDNT